MFKLQFIFNIILYWSQTGSTVVRKSCTLQSGFPNISSIHLHSYYSIIGPKHRCYNIIDYILYAVIYISVTVL